jgi:hypothetical protein
MTTPSEQHKAFQEGSSRAFDDYSGISLQSAFANPYESGSDLSRYWDEGYRNTEKNILKAEKLV